MAWKQAESRGVFSGLCPYGNGSAWRRAARTAEDPDSEWKACWRRTNAIPESPAEPSGAHARSPEMARLEAILFLANEPLPSRRLAKFANLADGGEARRLVHALNKLYDEADCAFRVEEVGGGYRLYTRGGVRGLRSEQKTIGLSNPAMETLAVVAYEQPISRAGVEAIRGVKCGEMLRRLMDQQLVRIAGRSSELGRPVLYGTTNRFLTNFGLRDLEDLPQWKEFRTLRSSTEQFARETARILREPID